MGNPRKASARKHKHQTRKYKPDVPSGRDTTYLQHVNEHGVYPFLQNVELRDHLRKSRVMFVMRGLPGSGKSRVCEAISMAYRNTAVFSTDSHFFKEDGTYEFNREKLTEYHTKNQENARAACMKGALSVVIDNTNVMRWEMQSYLKMALEYNYTVIYVSPLTAWAQDPDMLATRNKHAVDAELIGGRLKELVKLKPQYFAWFFNDKTSRELMDLGASYFRMAKLFVPNFLKNLGHGNKEEYEFSNLYSRMGTLHCTACYLGNKPTPAHLAYEQSDAVKTQWLNIFNTKVIGLLITPRTVGLRLELSPQQLPLWNNDQANDPDPYGSPSNAQPSNAWQTRGNAWQTPNNASIGNSSNPWPSLSNASPGNPTQVPSNAWQSPSNANQPQGNSQSSTSEKKQNPWHTKGQKPLQSTQRPSDASTVPSNEQNPSQAQQPNPSQSQNPDSSQSSTKKDIPKGLLGPKQLNAGNFTPMVGKSALKAHVTLGVAQDVLPLATGSDLLRLCAREHEYRAVHDRYHELPYGDTLLGSGVRVRYYGPEYGYMVYFDKPFSRKTIFNFRY